MSTSDSASLQQAMRSLHERTFFPVTDESLTDIGSTFMYRQKTSAPGEPRSDLHRAIDIENQAGETGDIVRAVYPGVFLEYRESETGGGNVIKLRHEFPESFRFKDKKIEYFYTWYSHLNSRSTPNVDKVVEKIKSWEPGITEIESGQEIALMGKSGSTKRVHLHLEVRIGTPKSLYAQLKSRTDANELRWGFDPHIHPLMLFPEERYVDEKSESIPTKLTLISPDQNGGDLAFCYQTDRQKPLLNRITTKIMARDESETPVKFHVIDLNLRTGIIPKNLELNPKPKETWLDDPNRTQPYFEPVPFGLKTLSYQTKIIIPKNWLAQVSSHNTDLYLQLEATDVWGNSVESDRFSSS